jgi:hypothetical protein
VRPALDVTVTVTPGVTVDAGDGDGELAIKKNIAPPATSDALTPSAMKSGSTALRSPELTIAEGAPGYAPPPRDVSRNVPQ